MAAAPVQRPVRRKRRREITANDIETAPIEEFTQEESTKGSYACYIQPFIQFAIDNGWTSPMYPEAMLRSDLTQEYIQNNEIKPICSSFNAETYLKVFQRDVCKGAQEPSHYQPFQSLRPATDR